MGATNAAEGVDRNDVGRQRALAKGGSGRDDRTRAVETVTAVKLPEAIATRAGGGVTRVIVDTPATDTPAAGAAMRACDLCLIPARPTIFDIWSSEVTRGKLKTFAKEYCFVLHQCPPMQESQRVMDGAAALESMGGLLRPLVASRVAYQEAAREGMGTTEIEPDG